jgi:PDZ domain
MRRPAAAAVIACVLLSSACGGGGRTTPTFDVPESVEGRVSVPDINATPPCQLAVGTGIGVEVVSVEPDMPVSGLLQPGDVITGVDGVSVDDSGEFIGIVRSHQVGDSVTMSVTRPGDDPFEADVELAAHVDGSGDPMVGIGIRTAVEFEDATNAPTSGTLDSPLTSVVSVDGSLYALDALRGTWLSLHSATPSGAWTATEGGIYTLVDGEPDQVVDATDPDASVAFEVEGWDGRWVLGSQAGLVLVYADRQAASGVQGALFAVDPTNGAIEWFWSPQDAERTDNPLPIFAVSSPSHDRTLVGTAQFDDQGNAEVVRFSLLDRKGEPELVAPPSGGQLPSGLVTIGWYTDTQVAYHQPAEGNVLLWDVDTGDLEEVALPVEPGSTAQFSPVGDGSHFIMITTNGLDLIQAGEGPSTRPLAVDCTADRIAPPGFVG